MNDTSMIVEMNGLFKAYKLLNKDKEIMYVITIEECVNCKADEKTVYIVSVTQEYDLIEPIEITRETFTDKEKALKSVDALIKDYIELIKVEMKKQPTPEDIFHDAVDYHIVKPDICKNGKFSLLITPIDDGVHVHKEPYLICINRENIKEVNDITADYQRIKSYTQVFEVRVNDNGVCKNFKKK